MAQGQHEQPAPEPEEPGDGEVKQNHSEAADALAEGFSEEKPEQAGKLVTGAEALAEQQQNPDLKDNSGTHG
jgi:hypothetical protein